MLLLENEIHVTLSCYGTNWLKSRHTGTTILWHTAHTDSAILTRILRTWIRFCPFITCKLMTAVIVWKCSKMLFDFRRREWVFGRLCVKNDGRKKMLCIQLLFVTTQERRGHGPCSCDKWHRCRPKVLAFQGIKIDDRIAFSTLLIFSLTPN